MEHMYSFNEVLAEAIKRYGKDKQKDMAIEECAELINALQKEKRHRVTDEDVITEVADVFIMCCQLAMMYGLDKVDEEIGRKINQLQERLGINS